MRSAIRLFSGLFVVAAACGSNDAQNGALPPATIAPPSIQSVTPTTIFRGRTTTVTVQGVAASFDDATSVATNDANVKVTRVHALSGDGLQIDLDVPANAAETALDLRVGGLTASAAITLDDALVLSPAHLRAPQGTTIDAEIVNHDPAHPLDAYRMTIDLGDGVTAEVDAATADVASITIDVGPKADAKARDLVVRLDDPGASPTDAGTDAGTGAATTTSIIAAALLVDANAAPSLPLDAPYDVTIPSGSDGALLLLSGAASKLVDVRVLSSTSDGAAFVTPELSLLDPVLGRARPLSSVGGDELLAFVDGKNDPELWIDPLGAIGAAHVRLWAHVAVAAASSESEPNDDRPHASPLVAPAIVSASLASADDVDCFSFDAKGTTVVRTIAAAASEATVDTDLTLYDPSGASLATNDDEDPAENDAFSFARTSFVGRVTACVRVGGNGGPLGDYRLAVISR